MPLIVFAVLFGLALGRVKGAGRESVIQVVEGVAEAMQHLIVWILGCAPLGVFALAVPLGARLGLAAAGAVITYIVLVVVLTIIEAAILLYPLAIIAGPMPALSFIS